MSINLVAIENARGMHERGVDELRRLPYTRNLHPLGVLAVVHNILVLPEADNIESLDAAHALLNYRLNQPGALEPPTPSLSKRALSQFSAGFKSPQELSAEWNRSIWPIALEIIKRPLDQFETWT